jgi:hypothetical protein
VRTIGTMLRVMLVGLLAVTATSSCSDSGDTAKVAPGAAAGNVVEVSGNVAATRDGAARKLAVGAEVFPDDVIDTANGSVVIVLRHNNARWSVESAQRARVDQSVAWTLPKQDGPGKIVDHASSAAGREGERSAADTRATTEGAQPPAPAAVTAPPPVGAPPPSGGAAGEPERNRDAMKESGAVGGAAGKPDKPENDGDAETNRPRSGPGNRALPRSPDPGLADPPPADVKASGPALGKLLEAKRAELQRCAGAKTKLVLVVKVAKGVPAIELSGGAVGGEARRCIEGVIRKLSLAGVSAEATLELGR